MGKNNQRVHFVGVGGSGISGVATLASKMGYEVSGCDLESSTAYIKNIFQGHDVKHIENVDFVVTTPAVFYQDGENPEITEAKKKNILITWQEFLGKYLCKGKKVICIAGTHGKSTTTAMVGKILEDAGLDPLVVVGATVPSWGGNSRFGEGDYFVIEADEFYDNFLHYNPDIILLNNIEFDHPDYFKSEDSVFESFQRFLSNLAGEKKLIANWSDEGVKKLNLDEVNVIKVKAKEGEKLNLKVPGEHNQSNARMARALGQELGINVGTVQKSLEGFSGIGRRSELIFDSNNIKIYDDYAHHPTAIAATLAALREVHQGKRIWAIVEPHGFARTSSLLNNYKGVFKDADKVIIGPIFKARDTETFGMTPEKVATASGHRDIIGVNSFEEIKTIVNKELEQGDVILVMGAGKSYVWARNILTISKSFKELTTFGVGGKIDTYIEVESRGELPEAVKKIKEKNLPIFILGGGSDILVSDKDFKGAVIKYIGNNIEIDGELLVAEAGVEWDELVEKAVEENLQGIECLSGIPGTTGAAPIQNIGAYGQEIKDTFVSLTAYDMENDKFVEFKDKDCLFGYRESIFKKKEYWQKYIITDVTLKLKKGGKPSITYDSLIRFLGEKNIKDPTLRDVRESVLTIRAGKFENPKEVGNAGSFFKNPTLTVEQLMKLKSTYPEIPARDNGDGTFKGMAGWFIEQAGWKGKTFKGAGVSSKHALILINPKGQATAKDIFELSEKIIEDIDKKFGVKLEREVQVINF